MMTNSKKPIRENGLITQQDLNRVNLRWLFTSSTCWNYERMMSTGYLNSILPVTEKIMKDNPEDLKKMLKMHNQFLNTSPQTGSLILGIDIALEEENGIDSLEAVAGLKTGLMGPLAAVGDSLFGAIVPTIMGSVAAYMALNGSAIGAIMWLLVNLIIIGLRWPMLNFAYRKGTDLVTTMSHKLTAITDSATLMGITVVGALIPTVIVAKVPFVFKSGKVSLKVQDSLDQILPALVPVLLVGLVYWLLGRKGMNSTKVIWMMLILAIVLYNFKILG